MVLTKTRLLKHDFPVHGCRGAMQTRRAVTSPRLNCRFSSSMLRCPLRLRTSGQVLEPPTLFASPLCIPAIEAGQGWGLLHIRVAVASLLVFTSTATPRQQDIPKTFLENFPPFRNDFAIAMFKSPGKTDFSSN